jgi:hypothetical protein
VVIEQKIYVGSIHVAAIKRVLVCVCVRPQLSAYIYTLSGGVCVQDYFIYATPPVSMWILKNGITWRSESGRGIWEQPTLSLAQNTHWPRLLLQLNK